MRILGLGGWDHDANAALIESGEILAVGEEERFTRIKHQGQQHRLSLDFCLKYCSSLKIDYIVVGYNDQTIARKLVATNRDILLSIYAHHEGVSHHLCHASAFYLSGFDQALVLTLDGFGDGVSSAAWLMSQSGIEPIWEIPYPHSLGGLWMSTSFFLGFGIRDAGKVMGLASYGNPRFQDLILNAFRLLSDGRYEFRLDCLRTENFLHSEHSLFKKIVRRPRAPSEAITQIHMDIAASLQRATEEIVLHMINQLQKKYSPTNLCLSGGVVLNSSLNGRILRDSRFKFIFVPPNPGDNGTALGGALHFNNVVNGFTNRKPLENAYFGEEFTQRQIENALCSSGVRYFVTDHVERIAAQRIAEGKIVGWFQGRSETGPRALGNRSILADPQNPKMQDTLNSRVKFREWFRPFAPSVLYEKASEWFEIRSESPFMSFVVPVLSHRQDMIPAVTHVDGTARVQTIRPSQNERFYNLIDEFYKITGVPIVINTSFNLMGDPIVNSPENAIACFLKSGIDVLAIGDAIAFKKEI